MSSTMDRMPWLRDLEPSPSLAGAQTLTAITRNVARAHGVQMSSDLADMVRGHANCEVSYNGERTTIVGMSHVLWLPDGSGSLTEPVFSAETALEVAQIAITDRWHAHLPAAERLKAQEEFEASLMEGYLGRGDTSADGIDRLQPPRT